MTKADWVCKKHIEKEKMIYCNDWMFKGSFECKRIQLEWFESKMMWVEWFEVQEVLSL